MNLGSEYRRDHNAKKNRLTKRTYVEIGARFRCKSDEWLEQLMRGNGYLLKKQLGNKTNAQLYLSSQSGPKLKCVKIHVDT